MFQRTVFILIACSVLVLQAVGVGAVGNPDNGPGCGLGKLAWMDYGSQKQIAPQVMMATTNATFGSQTFGISSGTSGCTHDGVIMKNKHINMASRTFESLAVDMAQGCIQDPSATSGETHARGYANPKFSGADH